MPVGGGRAWPDNEPTRRAKLAARTARGRAAVHGHTQRPGPVVPGTPVAPHSNARNHAGPVVAHVGGGDTCLRQISHVV